MIFRYIELLLFYYILADPTDFVRICEVSKTRKVDPTKYKKTIEKKNGMN